MKHDIKSIGEHFNVFGDFISAAPYGSGHINDTYAAVYNQGGKEVRYIFQRINHNVFKNPELLMDNISRVTKHQHEKYSGYQEDIFYQRSENRYEEFHQILRIVGYPSRYNPGMSLVKVALNTSNTPYLYVDVRKLYYRYQYISSYALYNAFEEELRKISGRKLSSIIQYLKSIEQISLAGITVRLEERKGKTASITGIIEAIERWAEESGKRFVVVFDEAQYLRYSRINFRSLIAYIYDNLPKITLILTGSEVGLVYDLLKANRPESELYGRYFYEITLGRLPRDKSIEFLERGFLENNITPPRSLLEEAVNVFDGIIGWLVYFGRICLDRGFSRDAVRETLSIGANLVAKELDELYQRSKRYKYVLEAIAQGLNTWSKIKRYIVATELKPVHDSALSQILLALQKMGIIEKKLGETSELEYRITDPVIEYAVRHSLT